MQTEVESVAETSNGRGLFYRTLVEYVSVTTALSPLFRYMRWSASRTSDDIYFLTLDPREIDQMKLFPPAAVPVTGPDALCGAVGGPWDRLTTSVDNHYIYRSVQARFESGVPWSETQLFRHPSYKDDHEKALRRGEKIEQIVDSIEKHGYQQQFDPDEVSSPIGRDDNTTNEWIGGVHVGDELIVGLDRHGEFLQLRNGRHRLAIARYLGVEEIPVILSLVHPKARSKLPQDARLIQTD